MQADIERRIVNTRIRILILALSLIHTAPLFARDKTDVLVMKNGDHMTCEVKGLDAGVLYVSFDYIDGTTSVDWSKVARLESSQLFVVRTESGAVYTGILRTPETTTDRPVKIEVLQPPEHEVATLNRSQIVRMVATSDKFWQRFNGGISFGQIYSKGNQSSQYNLSSEAIYVRERWNAGVNYESSLSSSTGTSPSTRNSTNLFALHLLPKQNWFYGGIGDLLQSSEQEINLQGTVGAGVGRYLMNTNRGSISLLGGLAWQGTTYTPSNIYANHQNLVAALFYADAQLFKFSKTNLNVNVVVLPALSDPGRIHTNMNASYYIKIISDLKWNISFYGNWDNQPPRGLNGSDYGTSSGLSWTFGLK
jgi:Protein of unknown function, DUF481